MNDTKKSGKSRLVFVDPASQTNVPDQLPTLPPPLAEEIAWTLLERGLPAPPEAVLELEKLFERRAPSLSSQFLFERLEQAPDTPRMQAAKMLIFGEKESARAEAKRRGISHTIVNRERKKARAGFQNVSARKLN